MSALREHGPTVVASVVLAGAVFGMTHGWDGVLTSFLLYFAGCLAATSLLFRAAFSVGRRVIAQI